MLKKLIKLADRLDQKGRSDLADEVDLIIKNISEENDKNLPKEIIDFDEVKDEDIEKLWEDE